MRLTNFRLKGIFVFERQKKKRSERDSEKLAGGLRIIFSFKQIDTENIIY